MGIGFLELVIIALAALVLLGPQRLPEIMRQAAKFYVHLRRTSNDFKSAFDHVVQEAEVELKRSELSQLEATIKARANDIARPMTSEKPSDSSSPDHGPASMESPKPRLDGPPSWDHTHDKKLGDS